MYTLNYQYFKSDDLFAKYNIKIKPEQKQLSKRPPELKKSHRKTSAFKSDTDETHKLDKKPELTSTLLPNSIQLTPQQYKTQRLDLTGPFNLFARPSQKTPDQSSQILQVQNSICVTPGLLKKDQTKKENADTALSMTGTTLKDSRTDKIRGLIRYIDFVLAQVTSSPTKSTLILPRPKQHRSGFGRRRPE